jgi:hypothetical protein
MGVNIGVGMNMGMGGINVGFNGFNRWSHPQVNYQSMNGYTHVDYSNGWNPYHHDQILKNNIDFVFQQYDYNRNGQLAGNEFFYAYRDLCLRMGLCPPMDYQTVFSAARACDTNGNGQVSKIEMFMMFKSIQGINY